LISKDGEHGFGEPKKKAEICYRKQKKNKKKPQNAPLCMDLY
jgi:hypothetical protein